MYQINKGERTMNKSPCKNCTKRNLGCHESCQDYNTYKKDMETINRKRRTELYYRDYILDRK